jgi:UDP-3-O-[3-hydroxymyristoyl] glucosamine N-acyltransferase
MVTKSVSEPGVYSSGMPCQPNKEWNKGNARIRKLESIIKRLSTVEKELASKS